MDIGVLVVIVFIIIFWVLPIHEQWLRDKDAEHEKWQRDNETGQNIEDEDDNTKDTSQYPYVGSICGNTFHRSGYPCAERIPAENVHGFESITDAKDSGYKPCTKCRPTETRKTVVTAKSKVKTKRKNSPKREFVCVISANGKNFHRPNCRLIKNIRDENLIGFYSISEPKALGFERCSRCKPGEGERKIIIIK